MSAGMTGLFERPHYAEPSPQPTLREPEQYTEETSFVPGTGTSPA
jgi:hypothetical protein